MIYAGIFGYLYYDIYVNVDRKEELKRWINERRNHSQEVEMSSIKRQGRDSNDFLRESRWYGYFDRILYCNIIEVWLTHRLSPLHRSTSCGNSIRRISSRRLRAIDAPSSTISTTIMISSSISVRKILHFTRIPSSTQSFHLQDHGYTGQYLSRLSVWSPLDR